MNALGPVRLEGAHIRLEPLQVEHAEGLWAAGQSPEIWRWLAVAPATLEEMRQYVSQAMAAAGQHPFAVVEKVTGRVVGSTRYLEVDEENRTAEIGWTWYARDVWATVVNPEAKFLLLRHAFETWGAMRVQFKADAKNVRSCTAIGRLGARLEGTLRNHRIRRDGTVRDSAVFSIIDTEWPDVKAGLLARIGG